MQPCWARCVLPVRLVLRAQRVDSLLLLNALALVRLKQRRYHLELELCEHEVQSRRVRRWAGWLTLAACAIASNAYGSGRNQSAIGCSNCMHHLERARLNRGREDGQTWWDNDAT